MTHTLQTLRHLLKDVIYCYTVAATVVNRACVIQMLWIIDANASATYCHCRAPQDAQVHAAWIQSMIQIFCVYDIAGLSPCLCTMKTSEHMFDTYSTVATQQSLLSWSTRMICCNIKFCCFRSKQVGHLSPKLGLQVGSAQRYAMQDFIFTVEPKAWLWAVSRLYIYSHMPLA